MARQSLIVLACKLIMSGRSNDVQAPTRMKSMRGAFETAHEEAAKHGVAPFRCGGTLAIADPMNLVGFARSWDELRAKLLLIDLVEQIIHAVDDLPTCSESSIKVRDRRDGPASRCTHSRDITGSSS
jgi:hypothetical protein